MKTIALKTLSLIFFITLILSCKKEKTIVVSDKITRLELTTGLNGIFDNDNSQLFFTNLIDFNKMDYDGIDSIKFVITNGTIQNAGVIYKVSLFNLTDSIVINNSEIDITNFGSTKNYYSKNILNDLSDHSINFGIKTNGYGKGGFMSTYLYLYR